MFYPGISLQCIRICKAKFLLLGVGYSICCLSNKVMTIAVRDQSDAAIDIWTGVTLCGLCLLLLSFLLYDNGVSLLSVLRVHNGCKLG